MSNLFEHCRTAAKFAVLRSNSELKRVIFIASLQTEQCQIYLNIAEPQPSLRCCEATANKEGNGYCKFTDRAMSNLFEYCRTAAKFAVLRSNSELKRVIFIASFQTEQCQIYLGYAEPQPSLRHCAATVNKKL